MQQYSAKQFYNTTTMTGLSFSPDSQKLLFSSDASQIFNVYEMGIAGGEKRQVTHSTTDTTLAISFFPHDKRFLFTRDQGGNELHHLYVSESDGSIVDLTPGEQLKAEFMNWSHQGERFWVLSNQRDPRNFDVYEFKTKNYESSLLFKNEEGWNVDTISGDGRWIAIAKTFSNTDTDLYLWDREKPAEPPILISSAREDALERALTFSPDNQKLYYSTDAHGEFLEVWCYDISSQKHTPVLQGQWDVTTIKFSKNGRYRVAYRNEDSCIQMYLHDMRAGKDITLPNLPEGQLFQVEFSPDEEKMAFYVNSDTSPSDLYVVTLNDMKATRLSHNLNPEIKQADLVEGDVIIYRSFDELEIPAILYKPQQASKDKPAPALLWIHGGPGGQSFKMYNPVIQFLVNHGIAVLAVNNRGSSGYGKTFFHADDLKHGDVDLKDCVWGKKYLQTLEWIDKDRIGITGGSYGGYMTVAALTYTPEEFKLGIDIFGVTNWVRTLEQIPVWWHAYREHLYNELGHPDRDREALMAKSPLFHADKITKPLLVVQGANDPRVLKVESDEIVAELRKNKVPVEYVLFEDEGHGFTKIANQIQAAEAYLTFCDQYL